MSGISKAGRALSAALAACAHQARILPPNEISEPVFYKTRYCSLGNDVSFSRFREPGRPADTHARYFDPAFLGHFNLGPWASFFVLPVYWNFLLSGEQYADGLTLQPGKLHLACSGGLSGLSIPPNQPWGADERIALAGQLGRQFTDRFSSSYRYVF